MVRIAGLGVFVMALACTVAGSTTLSVSASDAIAAPEPDAAGAADMTMIDALPERPLFRVFGTAQGLPSSTVHKLAQDRVGNLWIATLDGLARFDGVGFTVWRHDPDVVGSLPGNDVQQVVIDEDDRVWLAIQDAGVARYDPVSDRFESWRHDPDDPASLSTDRIWALADDGAGGIWAGGFRGGLSRLSADGHIENYRHAKDDAGSLCDDIILALARRDDTLWIGTANGLCRWREATEFESVAIPPITSGPVPRFVSDIEPDKANLWLATEAGVRVVPLDGTSPMRLPDALTQVQGSAVTIEPDGEVWYASVDGVRRWRVGSEDEAIIHHAHPGRALSLQAPGFLDVLRDREGSFWFATEGGGLAQLLPHWRAVRVFLANPDDPAGLPGGRVRLVSVDAHAHLWIAANYDDGIAELDPQSGQVVTWFKGGDGVSQPDPPMFSVLRDDERRVWSGNRGRVDRVDMASGAFRSVAADRDGTAFPVTPVRRLAALADGSLLAAFGGGGVALIDADTMAARFNPLGPTRHLPCAEVVDIRVDAQGATWLACEQGLLRAPRGRLDFVAVDGAPDAPMDGIAFAPDGHAWLHSLGSLGEYRVEGDRLIAVRTIDANAGWPMVKAGGLVVDGDRIVWVTTSRGLHSYDPATRRVATYDENDGLPSAEFSPTPPVLMAPTLVAAGTVAGPVIIDTRRLREPLPPGVLRWHSASVARDVSENPLELDASRPIDLRHDDRDLRVAVRLDSFTKPGAHRYRFRLEGYDDEWVQLTGQPERLFERLPSGQYTLAIEAIGSDGQPAGNTLQQVIRVGLPPWRQPWAVTLYVLLGLALAYASQRAYRLRLEERHALALAGERQRWAEQTSEAKTRFLASVGHEIRTPMAGLMGMNSLLMDTPLDARQRHYARSVGQAGQHMLTLVNDLLDLSRIEAGQLALDRSPVDLVAMLDAVIVDVEAAAEKKGLILSLRIEPGTPLGVVADGKRLKQILLNFLSNAIKFTPAGHVRLVLRMSCNHHAFCVEDDGPGLSAEMRAKLFTRYSQDDLGRSSGGTGLGLSIAHELTLLMGGDIGADARDEGGSCFWLRVPLQGESNIAVVNARDLPPLIVVDGDPLRADDLVVSLRAVGADVRYLDDARPPAVSGAIALIAATTDDQADQALFAAGLADHPHVLMLPLAASEPVPGPRRRLLTGPWRVGATIEAVSALALIGTESIGDAPIALQGDRRRPLSGLHLLIVEDDAILREVLSAQMTGMGATIDAAENGLLAMSLIDGRRFDAVLLDLDLPEIDGLQLLRLMKRRLGTGTPPVIIVTARQQADDEAQCRQAGAVHFFRKPVDADALATRLLEITGNAERIR